MHLLRKRAKTANKQTSLTKQSQTNSCESGEINLPKHLEMAFWVHKTHFICMVLTIKIGQIGLVRH